MSSLTAIGFDADDTLWQNEHFYRMTEERFTALLAEYAEPSTSRPGCWRPRSATCGTTGSASRASRCR